MTLRIDGRSTSSLRPIDIVFESLDRVDGSASFSFGPTKALASVAGPIQVRLIAEQPSKATFEVLIRPLSGISDTDAKSFSTVLRTLLAPCLVLTQNPRTLIQLVVQSLTSTTPNQDPSLAAAFINASSLALIQASSFPMLGVVCAAAVGHIKRHHSDPELNSERFLLDPNADEIRQCDAVGCVAVMFRSRNTSSSRKGDEEMDEDAEQVQGEIVWSSLHGISLQSDYDALLRLAKTGARLVYSAIRDRLWEEMESTSIVDEQLAKKMPKHKGGRVTLNVGPEKAMDTT